MTGSNKKSPRRIPNDDNEWEDMDARHDEAETKHQIEVIEESAARPRTPTASPRRRRTGTRSASVASSTPKKSAPIQRPRIPSRIAPTTTPAVVTEDELQIALTHGIRSTLKYTYDVFASFFYLMKKPLALFLVLWVLAITLNALSAQLKAIFSPFCILPGISRSSMCSSTMLDDADRRGIARHADYPAMVEIQSKTFEQLLDESVGGSGLALEIKKAEMATSDLVTLVRVSKLTSRDLLANTLVDFVDNARGTARGLQKLSAKVSGAVDNILAINDYALRTIESAETPQSLMHYIWPFGSSPSSSEILTSTFSQSLAVLSSSLQRLIVQAESSLHSLDKLEAQLSTVQEILAREDVQITSAHSDLLADLWSKLGGNRAQLRGFKDNLRLLRELGSYRTRALAHVVAALQALQTLSADMEELRERVAAPELAGGEMPLEVHVRSIRSGIERLNEGRLKAKEREEEAIQRILGAIDAS